ncbi:MAG TPA: AhpC/TSA family protein [Gaiellaceae bacterium]|nr:AhpC/TSA family protein [Gaiellaceae bacterium]
MQRALQQFDSVSLVAIVPGHPEEARHLRDNLDLTCLVVCDPEWTVHHALSLARGGVREVWLSPSLWRQYARLMFRGRLPRLPKQDAYPLGGVVVLTQDGSVVWRHASRTAGDYAAIEEIIAAVLAE